MSHSFIWRGGTLKLYCIQWVDEGRLSMVASSGSHSWEYMSKVETCQEMCISDILSPFKLFFTFYFRPKSENDRWRNIPMEAVCTTCTVKDMIPKPIYLEVSVYERVRNGSHHFWCRCPHRLSVGCTCVENQWCLPGLKDYTLLCVYLYFKLQAKFATTCSLFMTLQLSLWLLFIFHPGPSFSSFLIICFS